MSYATQTLIPLSLLQQRLADRYDGVPFWAPDEARRAINEALRIWSAATGQWKQAVVVPTVPNDPFVAVPGTLMQSTRLAWNGLPLGPASLFDFDYGIRNWRGTTTASSGAPVRPVYWARISLTLLAIYPADATWDINLGTNSLLVDGVRHTPILVDPSDCIDLGQETFNLLLGYAQHVLAFKVGGEVLVDSYPAWLAFLGAAAGRNAQFAASSFYRTLMGLDQQRRLRPVAMPSEAPVAGAASESADAVVYPPTRIKAS